MAAYNPIIYIAKHMYTQKYVLCDDLELENFPAHEYMILVVELPRLFADSIISHGTVKFTAHNLTEAKEYVAKHYPKGNPSYPSEQEYRARNVKPDPEVDDGK